jgi:hypothetical protein
MKTIELTLYKFNELSEEAKRTAIEQYKEGGQDQFYYDELIESINKALDLFGLETGRQYSDIRTGHIDDCILELSGVRLYKYLVNNYWNKLFTPKYKKSIDRAVKWSPYICKVYTVSDGSKYTQLYYKHQRGNDCVLTGVCYDMDILQPFYSFLERPEDNVTFSDLINEMSNAIVKAFNDLEEWQDSDEHISEMLEINKYDFTEDGNRY